MRAASFSCVGRYASLVPHGNSSILFVLSLQRFWAVFALFGLSVFVVFCRICSHKTDKAVAYNRGFATCEGKIVLFSGVKKYDWGLKPLSQWKTPPTLQSTDSDGAGTFLMPIKNPSGRDPSEGAKRFKCLDQFSVVGASGAVPLTGLSKSPVERFTVETFSRPLIVMFLLTLAS